MGGEAIFYLHLEWHGSTPTIPVPKTAGSDGFGLKSAAGFTIHNGHPILRRSRLQNIQYTDEKRGQDAIFNREILRTLGRSEATMIMLNTPLTYYLQDRSSTTF